MEITAGTLCSVIPVLVTILLITSPVGTCPNSRQRFGNARKRQGPPSGYDNCAKTEDNLINVHIVAHSHDDVGWLKTVDQYYYGTQQEIQFAKVKDILDSVVYSLLQDPQRKFIYVESAFFFKWWDEQSASTQKEVKKLVSDGRLEFIGGAWSMNDEATTHYQSIIDQFTWGLRRLNDTFGDWGRPKVGWQIDPFGHSREMASLFAQMSYDGYFFGRLHYKDKARRMASKEMEMVWEASDDLGEAADIFTGILFNNYSPPPGFCWDMLCSDEMFDDNNTSMWYNVDSLLQKFFAHADEISESYRSNHILITMGGDFNYQHAELWYTNLDKLIKYGNALKSNGSKYHLLYSTPSCYLKSLKETNQPWPTYSDDFFPYASDETAVWTGYFTSRPTFKRYERKANHFLQICKQLTSVAFLTSDYNQSLTTQLTLLREQMGVLQHHDAVTGTEKQHVANDYIQKTYIALEGCNSNARTILNKLMKPTQKDGGQPQFEFDSCHYLNISQCHISESNDKFLVTIYNPLAHVTSQAVRFPVAEGVYQVRDYRNIPVKIQVLPVTERAKKMGAEAEFEIVFLAKEIPPLGYKSYYVKAVANASSPLNSWLEPPIIEKEVTIGNGNVQAKFDTGSGLLSSVIIDGKEHKVTQEFFYYKAAQGYNTDTDSRPAGAYILRPDGQEVPKRMDKASLFMVRGDVVDEVYQKFNDWITQVVRIYHDNTTAIEFSWTVGPIPVSDYRGKEIVTRFSSVIANEGVFYTDSNGRQMMRRTRNLEPLWREELVAINYYPVNSKIFIEDGETRMAVLTDRAQGATSLKDGQIDVLVHRRLVQDDGFGVEEELNEKQMDEGLIATGTFKLLINGLKKDMNPTPAAKERFQQSQMQLGNWLFISNVHETYRDWQRKYRNNYSPLAMALPQNIQLLTLEPWRDNSYLVRLEHLLEKDEDPIYSKTVTFDIVKMFGDLFDIRSIRETNLAGNQWLSEVNRFKFAKDKKKKKKDHEMKPIELEKKRNSDLGQVKITFSPMQIRTSLEYQCEIIETSI